MAKESAEIAKKDQPEVEETAVEEADPTAVHLQDVLDEVTEMHAATCQQLGAARAKIRKQDVLITQLRSALVKATRGEVDEGS